MKRADFQISVFALATALAFLCSPSLSYAAGIRVKHFRTGEVLGNAVPGEVLVKFSPSATPEERERISRGIGAKAVKEISGIGWTRVKLAEGTSVEEAMRYYSQSGQVSNTQPNFFYRALGQVPNDPKLSGQYALPQISAFAGWEFQTGLPPAGKTTVSVIDTGVDTTHPDLTAKTTPTMPYWRNTFSNNSNVSDLLSNGHGTGVAGVAAASTNNSAGIAGISWGGQILPIQVFHNGTDPSGVTDCRPSEVCANDADVVEGITWTVAVATTNPGDLGRTIINMSLGCTPGSDPQECPTNCTATMQSAVQLALNSNIPVVAAAGNEHPFFNPNKVVECPAIIPGVIAAGATREGGEIASFSANGPQLWVAAPGEDVLLTANGGGYINNSGTSFSAPAVAGLISLILSEDPLASTTTVRTILQETADDFGELGHDNIYGFGQVNVFKALRRADRGTIADFAGEKSLTAFPNPFRPSSQSQATIEIPPGLDGAGLSIKIYTMSGELVRSLNTRSWDGRNDSGRQVASGVYLYLVQTERGKGRGRIAVLR